MRADRYIISIPPVLLHMDVEPNSFVQTDRDRQHAAWDIAFNEIVASGGPCGFVTSWPSMPKEKRPNNALSHPNWPGAFVWLAKGS